jgi:hypothetical protein
MNASVPSRDTGWRGRHQRQAQRSGENADRADDHEDRQRQADQHLAHGAADEGGVVGDLDQLVTSVKRSLSRAMARSTPAAISMVFEPAWRTMPMPMTRWPSRRTKDSASAGEKHDRGDIADAHVVADDRGLHLFFRDHRGVGADQQLLIAGAEAARGHVERAPGAARWPRLPP